MNREQTAIHEAGHFVVARALDLEIESVSIIPDEESLGRVRHTHAAIDELVEESGYDDTKLSEHLTMTVAGKVAESIAGMEYDPDDDLANITELAFRLGPAPDADGVLDARPLIEAAEAEARAILTERWVEVREFADSLLANDSLSGLDTCSVSEPRGDSS